MEPGTDPLDLALSGMHRVLLHVAGRLPDDVLAEARRMLAEGDWVYLAEAVTSELVTRKIAVRATDRAALAAFHHSVAGVDRLPLFGNLPLATATPATGHRFSPGPAPHDDADTAMLRSVRLVPGAAALWRAWRETEESPDAPPARIYLVEVTAGPWRVGGELQRVAAAVTAEPPRVEVYSSADDLSPYQRALAAGAQLLWRADAAEPVLVDTPASGRVVVERAISAAKAEDWETVRRLVDWALLGAPHLVRALAQFTAADRAQAAEGLRMLLDASVSEPYDPTAVSHPLRQLMSALRDTEEVRSPDEAQRQEWLRRLQVPEVPGDGLTAGQLAQLAWLRQRAQAIGEVYLLRTRDGLVLPLALAPERNRIVAVFGDDAVAEASTASPPMPEALATALAAARRGDLAVLHAMIDWTLSEAPLVATPAEGVPGHYVRGVDSGIAEIKRRAGSWRYAAAELLPIARRLAAARLVRPATAAERDAVLPLVQISPLRAEATETQRAFFDPLRERASALREVWIVETSDTSLPVVRIPDGELIVLPLDSAAYQW